LHNTALAQKFFWSFHVYQVSTPTNFNPLNPMVKSVF
jgi:hypothetical protein